jgi:hypothetical protein
MGLIRTAIVAGICISLVPADQKDREVLYQRAESAVQWTSTFCTRNPRTCENAGVLWTAFVDKAAFAAASGYDIAIRHMGQSEADTRIISTVTAPHAQPVHRVSATAPPDTLTTTDRQYQWRGHAKANGT